MIGIPAIDEKLRAQSQRERWRIARLGTLHLLVERRDEVFLILRIGSLLIVEGCIHGRTLRDDEIVGSRHHRRSGVEQRHQGCLQILCLVLHLRHLQTVVVSHAIGREELQLSRLARLVSLCGYIAIALDDGILLLQNLKAMGLVKHRIVGTGDFESELLGGDVQPAFLCLGLCLQLIATGCIDRRKLYALREGESIIGITAGSRVLREGDFRLVQIPCCSLHYLSLFYGFSAGLQGEVLPISQLETLLQGHLLAGDACIKA